MERVEEYGILYGLDDTTKTRLQTGFDEIRAIAGWENFRIPAYVWEYVDQHDRDKNIAFLESVLYGSGISDPLEPTCPALTADLQFAFVYTLFLYLEWWRDTPDKPGEYYLLQMYSDDIGIPRSAIHVYSMRTDVLGVTVDHPLLSQLPDNKWGVHEWWITNDPSDQWGYIWAGNGNAGGFTEKDVDVDEGSYNGFYGDAWIEEGEGWDDYGEVAVWPDEAFLFPAGIPAGISVNSTYEILSGSARFRDFGLMEGSIQLATALNVGDTVTVSNGSTTYFTGIVTEVRQNLAEGIYDHRIADPVTASGGKAIYSSGNAITALQEAIENAGGTFSTSMTTSETVFYPGEEQDFWQFARCVCYAVGGVLQYTKEGTYQLIETPTERSITDDDVIADDAPSITENPHAYANLVQVTVDATWTEPATEPVVDSYTIGGATYSATRLGEQIQTETVNFGDADVTTTYTYDADGYLVSKQITEEGSGLGATKKQSTITWTNIQDSGNKYDVSETHEEWTYCQLYDNTSETYYTAWVPTSKTTRDWHVDLTGMASYTEEIWGSTPLFAGNPNVSTELYPTLGELIRRYKYVGSVILDPEAGPIEGRGMAKKYAYTHNGFEDNGGVPTGTVGYVYIGAEERSVSPPALETAKAEETHEVHIIASAQDTNAINKLGKHKYETHAIALDTSTGLQNFAVGVLKEKARIRSADISLSIDAGTIYPLETILWRGYRWTVESVNIDIERWTQTITMTTGSSCAALEQALFKLPVTWVDDVRNAIVMKTSQYNNVARGKVISRKGKNRYMVQAEGMAEPVEARAIEGQLVPVGGTVLLVRPTGKLQPWMLLSLSKEHTVEIPSTVEISVTPDVDGVPAVTSFTADTYTAVATADIVTLSWNMETSLYAAYGVEISLGDGSDPIIVPAGNNTLATTIGSVGTFTPTIKPYIEVGGAKQYGNEVSLDASITAIGPAVDHIELVGASNDTVFYGFLYGVNFYYNATLDAAKLDKLEISYDGGATWSTYTSGYSGNSIMKIYTWSSDDAGSTSIQAKITFTQANGQQWTSAVTSLPITVAEHDGATEGVIGLKEYYYFPRAGDYTETWTTISHETPTLLSVDGVGGSKLDFELQFDVTTVGTAGSGIIFHVPMRYRPIEYGQTSGGSDSQIVFTVKYESGELRAFIDTASGYRLPWKNGGSWSDDPSIRYTVIGNSDTGTVKFVHSVSSPEIQVYFNGSYIDETDLGGYYYQYVWEIPGVTNPVRESVRSIRYIQAFPSGSNNVSNVTLTVHRRLIEKCSIVGGSWSASTGYSIPVVFHLPDQPYSFSWTPPY